MLKSRIVKGNLWRALLLIILMVGAIGISVQSNSTPDVAEAAPGDVRITGILDGTFTGGQPKAIELYVEGTVDLSTLKIVRGSNNNTFGSGSNDEVTLSGTFTDQFVYLVGSGDTSDFQTIFGTSGDFANIILDNSLISGNGNDGFQLRRVSDDGVIDQVDNDQDDTNIYADSFMYRNDCTGPDGANFVTANWEIPGNGELVGDSASEIAAAVPFGTWSLASCAVINEFVFNHTGTDTNEFVEIFGTPNTDFSNLRVLIIEGDGTGAGIIDEAYTVGTTNGSGIGYTGFRNDEMQNDAQTILLVTNFTGSEGDDVDDDNDGTLNSTLPWDSIIDSVAVEDGGTLYSSVVLVRGSDGNSFTFGGASRLPNGVDTDSAADWTRNNFSPAPSLTINAANATQREAINSPEALNEAGTADAPPVVVSTTPSQGQADVAIDANIEINFNETVLLTDPIGTLVCTVTGNKTFSRSGVAPAVLNPDVDFALGESCTLTVSSSQVVDIDPPSGLNLDGDGDGSAGDDFVLNFSIIGPTMIYDLQENGARFGQSGPFTVTGIVTNDVQGPGQLNGFFMQDPIGDGDVTTSDGIFVAASTAILDVNVGDEVQVTGTVSETFSQTTLTATNIVRVSIGNVITPTDVTLPIPSLSDYENFEGMLIRVLGEDGQLTVTDSFNLGRFGEIRVSGKGRLFNSTNVHTPGSAAQINLADENARNQLIIDDLADGTLDRFTPGNVPYIPTTATQFRNGFTTSSITGTLSFGFGEYRVRPTSTPVWTNSNPRTPAPTITGGIRVVSFNVLNYYNNDDGFPTDRGADTQIELDRQTQKLVAAICEINADIVGLIEIENEADGGPSAIQDLVTALNAQSGCGPYMPVLDGLIGGDSIKVGFIYKATTVTPVGASAILTSAVDARFDDGRNRPALAQTFDDNFGGRVTVVVNHFKSKGSDCGGAPDDDPVQGNCNGTRTNAARALVDWLAGDPTGSGDPDFLIIGDINAYAQEDPIVALEQGADDAAATGDDYTDLIEQFVGPGNVAYSFTFFGGDNPGGRGSGYLDHALANNSLLGQVTGVAEWHINSDEPSHRSYNDAVVTSGESSSEHTPEYLYQPDAYRSSDHDPVIIGLDLTNDTEEASDLDTVFRIGDWVETPIAGTQGGTALCASSPLASLSIPFNGTTFTVFHVQQAGGGEYDIEINGSAVNTSVGTNGAGPFIVSASGTDPSATTGNTGRVRVRSGLVCIDYFDVTPPTFPGDAPALQTSNATDTGVTVANANCADGRANVTLNFDWSVETTSHGLSILFISNGEIVHSQRLFVTTPPFISLTGPFAVQVYYWELAFGPDIPGFSETEVTPGSPLNITDTELVVQVRNNGTGACESISVDYACQAGNATIVQDTDMCVFPN